MVLQYYAHVRENAHGHKEYQTVAQHLTGTAELCRKFAAAFGAEADGELAGLSHDIGKCTDAFQDHLLNDGPTVDHATAGAMACAMRGNPYVSACVAGHHGGLADFGNMRTARKADGTFYGRLLKGREEQYLEHCGESGVALPQPTVSAAQKSDPLQASFWTRMLYSCLVDADFLDTEQFMNGERGRGGYDDIPTLLARLQAHIEPWQQPRGELNRLRCEILNTCIEAGSKSKGLYTLTVPTGGGKTVASLAFALRHAVEHGMQRVIYVPYTSIIDQNAQVFRDILGSGNVLEHHSGVQFDLSDSAPAEAVRKALATENWDMPVVVTTAVQFFESMYAARSSRCRKLHNLANSVVIFDEAQMLPLAHLRPCVAAMASLAEQFCSTVVLCTATQPSLDDLLRTYAPDCPVTELCPQTAALYDRFRRVTFQQAGTLTDEVLAERLSEQRQVLCIVNSRKAAQSIYALLPQEGSYHLSTLMVPAQRQALLEKIKERLKRGEPCRVVSTSLIEAGVDVDFPAVYRELAGLDSVMQAAGRCNREGKRSADESFVTIFERTELPPQLFQAAVGAAREALGEDRDPAAPETMTRYFYRLRDLTGDALDRQGVIEAFTHGIKGCEFPFRTVAENFRLIDRNTYTVYIPYGEGAALLRRLQDGECSKGLYRKLGRYAVSVYDKHYQALYNAGALLTAREVPVLDEDSAILTDLTLYSETMGLSLEPETGKAEFI